MKLSRMVQNGTAKVNGSTLEHVDFNFRGTVEIDMDVKHIGDSAFNDCKHVTEIKIPEGVETIHAGAFMGCSSLKEIEIPNSVEKVGSYAFYGCKDLEVVTMPQAAEKGEHMFDGGTHPAIVNYTDEHRIVVGVMNTERAIETGRIDAQLSDLVGSGKASVNNGVLEYVDPEFKGKLNIDMDIREIGPDACKGCKDMMEIHIPEGVDTIGAGAFLGCESLKEIKLPDSVEFVGNYAMWGCTSLQEATVPQSARLEGERIFENCPELAVVNYTSENGAAIGVGNSEKMIEHGYINANLSDLVANGQAVISYGCLDRVDPNFVGGINIDMDIQQISSMAFCDCKHVTEINIPDSVEIIGSGAFMGCTSLKEITIPDSVQYVGDYALYGCTNLEEVKMPQQAIHGEHVLDGAEPNQVTYTNEHGAAVGVASSSEMSLDDYVDRVGRDSTSSSKDDVNDNANDNANENDGGFDL